MKFDKNINIVNTWQEFSLYTLPPELASLPTMQAQPWLCVGSGDARGLLEGPIFDREGNLLICHTTRPQSKIIKISMKDKTVSTFFVPQPNQMPCGLAVHADGRVFAAAICGDYGKIFIIKSDGTLEREIIPEYEGNVLKPDDLVFDMDGNLYFTDFRGSVYNAIGGVYCLKAEGNYTELSRLLANVACGNGISFSPDYRVLWVAETARNCVLRVTLSMVQRDKPADLAVRCVYRGTGNAVADSNKVDSAGNVYQAMMWGGRIVVLNGLGIPIANIVVPDWDKGEHLNSPNLAIRPKTDEGYFIGTGMDGAWIFKFKALAKAQELFSHKNI